VFGVFEVISSFLIWNSYAATAPIANLEAEQMVLPAGASIVDDTNASGGQAVYFTQNVTTATGQVSLPSEATSVSLSVRGTKCRGARPMVEVRIDNQIVIAKTMVNTPSWMTLVSPTVSLASGSHSVALSFYANRCSTMTADRLYLNGVPPTPPTAPTVTLSASPTSVTSGTSSTLTWSASNADSCTASGAWSGSKPTSGSANTGALYADSTFNLSCTGSGAASSSTTVTVSSSTNMSPPAGYNVNQLAFVDTFAGPQLDTTKWNTYITSRAANGWPWNSTGLPTGGSAVSGPYGNVLDYYMPNNIQVNRGTNLDIVPSSAVRGYSYSSSVLTTYGKFQLTSGYVQVKAKMPNTSTGGWPAIWFLPGPGGSGGDRGEIDLFEGGFLPSDAGLPSTTPANRIFCSHYNGPTTGWVKTCIDAGVDLTASYHIYGMEYIPGVSVKTFLDGRLVGSFTSDINTDPYELIINNSFASPSTSGWHTTGALSSPTTMSVAEVQAYH
jgi:beta-glucanase (GH16 family)